MRINLIGNGTMGSIKRCNESIMVDDILFDIGSGTVKQIERLKLYTERINYVVISHFHSDHILDITNYLIGRAIRREDYKKVKIIGGVGLKNIVKALLTLTHSDRNPNKYDDIEELYNLEFVELKGGDVFETPEFKLTAYDLQHGNCKPILGYILEKENKKIGYATDTSACENLYKICEECEIIFCDSTNIKSTPMHIGAEEVKMLAEKYTNCKFYAIHRGDYEIENGLVEFPEDGDEINL